jgi:hypothetical protein
MLLNSSFGVLRAGVQSMATAAFGGVLVRTPLVANAPRLWRGCASSHNICSIASIPALKTSCQAARLTWLSISLRRVPKSNPLDQHRLGAILQRLNLRALIIFGPTPQKLAQLPGCRLLQRASPRAIEPAKIS